VEGSEQGEFRSELWRQMSDLENCWNRAFIVRFPFITMTVGCSVI